MRSAEDVESYLIKMQLATESPKPGLWIVRSGSLQAETVVITIAGPVVVFRVKVMELPPPGRQAVREALYETLLRLNASEMLYGAYGLEGDSVVLGGCLSLENLDYSEFQATFEDLTLALAKHYEQLSKFRVAA